MIRITQRTANMQFTEIIGDIISMELDDEGWWILTSANPFVNRRRVRQVDVVLTEIDVPDTNSTEHLVSVMFPTQSTDDDWTEKKFDEWVSNMIRDNYMHCERCRTLISGMAPPFSHDEICPNCGGPIRWVLHRSNLYDEFKPERCPDAPEDVQTPAVLPLRKLIIKDRGGAVDGA